MKKKTVDTGPKSHHSFLYVRDNKESLLSVFRNIFIKNSEAKAVPRLKITPKGVVRTGKPQLYLDKKLT